VVAFPLDILFHSENGWARNSFLMTGYFFIYGNPSAMPVLDAWLFVHLWKSVSHART